jgi:Bacterial SH3 domain
MLVVRLVLSAAALANTTFIGPGAEAATLASVAALAPLYAAETYNSRVLLTLHPGVNFEVEGCDGIWCRVNVDISSSGWLSETLSFSCRRPPNCGPPTNSVRIRVLGSAALSAGV